MSKVVKVTVEGRPLEVDCAAAKCETYGDLRDAVAAQTGVASHAGQVFIDEHDEEMRPDQKIRFPVSTKLFLRTALDVTIREGDKTFSSRAFSHWTVDALRHHFLMKTHRQLKTLTMDGRELPDKETLQELDVRSGSTLVGAIPVTIVDRQCDLETSLETYESKTVEDLLKAYAEKMRRILHDGTKLFLKGKSLSINESVYELRVEPDTTFELQTPAFEIKVEVMKPRGATHFSVSVQDSHTIGRIKDEYARISHDVVERSDRLVLRMDELDDNARVYTLPIQAGTILRLQKEDIAMVFRYICADCGSEVKLKKTDVVRCRECGHRIVFKKRTTAPTQYLAR